MPYVTGRAYGATGFPVVNVELALQRDRQQPLICNAQSGSFCLLAVAIVGQGLVPETMS